ETSLRLPKCLISKKLRFRGAQPLIDELKVAILTSESRGDTRQIRLFRTLERMDTLQSLSRTDVGNVGRHRKATLGSFGVWHHHWRCPGTHVSRFLPPTSVTPL